MFLGVLTNLRNFNRIKNIQETVLFVRIPASSKSTLKSTLGFKSFASAEATIAGIELHRMLKKGQMKNSENIPAWKQFYKLAA